MTSLEVPGQMFPMSEVLGNPRVAGLRIELRLFGL